MDFTNLFLYKIIFVIEILIAMFLFSYKLKFRKYPYIRIPLVIIIATLISIFFPIPKEFGYTWYYSSFLFFFLFLVCFLGLFFIYDTSPKNLFLIGVTSYTAQHLSYQLYSLLCFAFKFNSSIQNLYNDEIIDVAFNIINVLRVIITIVVYTLVYVIIFNLFITKRPKINRISSFSIVIVSFLVLIIDIIANSIVVYNNDQRNIITDVIISVYNILSCLMIFFILFFLLNIRSLKQELVINAMLLEQAKSKFEESRKNMELINIKCHDLKHQIRKFNSSNIDAGTLKNLENLIEIYDSNMNTNNKALDIILMEKKLLCQKEEINLKCFVDGSQLSFIIDSDLYSLFGNALDNAIEASRKINDKDKRTINVITKNINGFISITFENFYEGKIDTSNSFLPLTTKDDHSYHGFGLKSIKMIVEKYDGELSINTENEIFTLSIMFHKKYNQ